MKILGRCDEKLKEWILSDQQGEKKSEFRFGKGDAVRSSSVIHLPVSWMEKNFSLKLHVIDETVPFLVGVEAIEKMGMILDFKNQKIMIDNKWEEMQRSTSGHVLWSKLKIRWEADEEIKKVFLIEDKTRQESS